MKRLLMAVTAVVAIASAGESRGAVVHYRSNYRQSSAPTVYGSQYGNAGYSYGGNYGGNYGYRSNYGRRQGVFSSMMEFERRKNAALRRMFYGY